MPYSPRFKKRQEFLRALEKHGSISRASCEIRVDSAQVRRWRNRDPIFAEQVRVAKEVGLEAHLNVLEDEIDRRAVQGVEHTVYQGGQAVGKRREYSDLLLMFRTKRLDPKYRDQQIIDPNSNSIQIVVNVLADRDGRPAVEPVRLTPMNLLLPALEPNQIIQPRAIKKRRRDGMSPEARAQLGRPDPEDPTPTQREEGS